MKVKMKDARTPLIIEVLPTDLRGAVVGDPKNCAGARACKRQTGAEEVIFNRTVAIIDGVRYMLPESATKAVEKFDNMSGFFPPGVYALRPPAPSERLAYMRRAWREQGRDWRRDGSRPHLSRSRPRHIANVREPARG